MAEDLGSWQHENENARMRVIKYGPSLAQPESIVVILASQLESVGVSIRLDKAELKALKDFLA